MKTESNSLAASHSVTEESKDGFLKQKFVKFQSAAETTPVISTYFEEARHFQNKLSKSMH